VRAGGDVGMSEHNGKRPPLDYHTPRPRNRVTLTEVAVILAMLSVAAAVGIIALYFLDR
jgi:hypothetical protein